jgi:hypothetical protein
MVDTIAAARPFTYVWHGLSFGRRRARPSDVVVEDVDRFVTGLDADRNRCPGPRLPTRRRTRREAIELFLRVLLGEWPPCDLTPWLSRYHQDLVEKRVRPSTAQLYMHSARVFLAYLRGRKKQLLELKARDFARYEQYQRTRFRKMMGRRPSRKPQEAKR